MEIMKLKIAVTNAWIALALASFISCKKAPAPTSPVAETPSSSQNARETFSPEFLERFAKRRKRTLEMIARDRAELVRPAPADFQPENVRRKLAIKLVLENKKVRIGQQPRYRLELQNVGREDLFLAESDKSFIKFGRLTWQFKFKALLTPPGGDEERLLGAESRAPRAIRATEEIVLPNSRFMSEEQRAQAMKEFGDAERSKQELTVTLSSGETLVTRGDQTGSPFRALNAEPDFEQPGTYRLRFVYEEPELPLPSEEEMQALIKKGSTREDHFKVIRKANEDRLGVVSSNIESFEVLP
jgi:hypothetical protein